MYKNGKVKKWYVVSDSLGGDPDIVVQSVGNLKKFIKLSVRTLVSAKDIINESFPYVGLWQMTRGLYQVFVLLCYVNVGISRGPGLTHGHPMYQGEPPVLKTEVVLFKL